MRVPGLKAKVLNEAILGCGTYIRIVEPEIVCFEEAVQAMDELSRVAVTSDLFVVIESAPTVNLAARLPLHAGGQVVVVNHGLVEMASAE